MKRKKQQNLSKQKKLVAALVLAALVAGFGLWVVFYYTTQLSLALVGEERITVGLHGVYEEPGVKGMFHGRGIEDKVEISGEVTTSVPGDYTLTYRLGSLTVQRTVTVLDHMDPELHLADGEAVQELKLGEDFKEPGYTAKDHKDRDLTEQVTVSDTDFTRAGTKEVIYQVEDHRGKKTRLVRQVEVLPNTDYDSPGLPICMYHYVYDENNPPEDLHRRYGNYISMQDLEEELNWLNKEGYYYPTWKEVRAYVDGELLLPEKSIVLCFDDGATSFLENGIPVLEKCKVPATCFMITSSNGKEKIAGYQSDYVRYESHSHNMHRPGGNIGHGGIFTAISHEEGMADLKKSIEICGSNDAFAYPFGDYNDRSKDMLEEAGFLCAVTTQYGKARPGYDSLLLPRVRMVMGQSLQKFISSVEP